MNRRSVLGFLSCLPFLGFLGKAQAGNVRKSYETCPFHPKETEARWVPLTDGHIGSQFVAPGRIGFVDPAKPQEYYCVHCLAELARNSNVTRLVTDPLLRPAIRGVI